MARKMHPGNVYDSQGNRLMSSEEFRQRLGQTLGFLISSDDHELIAADDLLDDDWDETIIR